MGALKNWVALQNQADCFFEIADWHALTTGYADSKTLRENTLDVALDLLAVGIDPQKSVLFRQSDVKEHSELFLLLGMMPPLRWLERNPTYKSQIQELKEKDLGTYGFLGYPVLQAADILVYRADWVPVGQDQLPHLELTREIARRFNSLYKPVFPEPQAKLTASPVLPGTDGRKMSKSYGNTIELSTDEKTLRAKVGQMITDPKKVRKGDPGRPEICPVFALHKIFNAAEIDPIARDCRSGALGCVDCKKNLANHIIAELAPVWERRRELKAQPERVEEVLRSGADRARKEAQATLALVKEAMHLTDG